MSMRLLVKLLLVVGIGVVVFVSSYISYRCGLVAGYDNASQVSYRVALDSSLAQSPAVKKIIQEQYRASFDAYFESLKNSPQMERILKDYFANLPLCSSFGEN